MSIAWERIMHLQVGLAKSGDMFHVGFNYGADENLDNLSTADLIIQWDAEIKDLLLDVMSLEMTLQYLYCYCIKPETVHTSQRVYESVPGVQSGEAVPTNVALELRLFQNEVNSRHNGKMYIPGAPEEALGGSRWLSAWLTTHVGPLAAAMIAPLTGGSANYTPVIVARYFDGVLVGPIGYPVLQVAPSFSPATQKRRRTELRTVHP